MGDASEPLLFRMLFNKRLPRHSGGQNAALAVKKLNNIRQDRFIRNQQVAGSSPAGGSRNLN